MHRLLESLKEHVLLSNPPFATISNINLQPLKKALFDNPFGNCKPHFMMNIAFITFMVKIYYIYGEPDYYTYG